MSFAECLHPWRRLNKTSAYSFDEIHPLPLHREDFTNQNNGEQQTIPFCFVCTYILRKLQHPMLWNNLIWKLKDEKKSVFKRFAAMCWSCAVTGTLSSTPEWDHSTKHSIPHLLLQVWREGKLSASSASMAPSELKDFVPQVLFSSVGTVFHLTGMLEK